MRAPHRIPSLILIVGFAVGIFTTAASAQTNTNTWSAFNDFYVDVPATGGNGDYTQSTWIANAGTWPYDTGLTNPNAWGYAGVNLNGFGFPTSVGTYVPPSSGGVYSFTSGGVYAGSGVSYYLGGSNYYIGYNSTYGPVSQIAKYTQEWFGGTPNYTNNPGGINDKYLWIQSTGLSPSTDGLGAMVTWTAPTSGTYTFTGSYVNGNYGDVSTDFAIVDSKNNVALPKQTLAPNSSVNTYSFNRVYQAGDVVQFQVGTPAAAQGSPLGLEANISRVTQSIGTTWNAATDFYLTPTASGWTGATSPSTAGAAFGYYAANVNGSGYASQIGSFFTPEFSGSGSQSLYQYSSMAPIGAGTVVGTPGWANIGSGTTDGAGFAYYSDTFGWGTSLGKYDTPWFAGAPGLSQGLTNLIWMQPGWLSGSEVEGIAPVVTWTAPETGYYTLSGQFVSGNQPGNGASVAIVAGFNNTQSALELARTVLANNSFQSFDFTRFYEAGTVVQFQAGSSFTTGNSVGLQLNITAVPEPSTIIAAIGLLGLMLWPARRFLWRSTERNTV